MPSFPLVDGEPDASCDSPFAEFRLKERGGQPADRRLAILRLCLRSTWPVATDTFVAGDVPLLLTKMGQIPVDK
jgi:hypothetical protein